MVKPMTTLQVDELGSMNHCKFASIENSRETTVFASINVCLYWGRRSFYVFAWNEIRRFKSLHFIARKLQKYTKSIVSDFLSLCFGVCIFKVYGIYFLCSVVFRSGMNY